MADPAGKALMMLTLAPGTTLDEAAQALVKQFSLQPTDSRRITVNGFPALAILADQVQQDPQTGQTVAGVRTQLYLVQDGKTMYALVGAAAPADFAAYQPAFTATMEGFARLTDPDKLGRQPEHLHVKTLKLRSNLGQALKSQGVPEKRLEEMAILNGMQLNEQVNAGSLIKVVGK